jgi:hypothetical protein
VPTRARYAIMGGGFPSVPPAKERPDSEILG